MRGGMHHKIGTGQRARDSVRVEDGTTKYLEARNHPHQVVFENEGAAAQCVERGPPQTRVEHEPARVRPVGTPGSQDEGEHAQQHVGRGCARHQDGERGCEAWWGGKKRRVTVTTMIILKKNIETIPKRGPLSRPGRSSNYYTYRCRHPNPSEAGCPDLEWSPAYPTCLEPLFLCWIALEVWYAS